MWSSIEKGLIRFCLVIDSVVYGIVSKLFGLFVELANISSEFFSDSVISSFVNRLYILAGVVALFLITYSLLISIANPDEIIKGKLSGPKILMNVVTSIILIALLPTIFDFMYTVQNAVLDDNIIGRVFLGTTTSANISTEVNGTLLDGESQVGEDGQRYEHTIESIEIKSTVAQQGNNLAFSVMNAFIYPNDNNGDGNPDDVVADWSEGWGTYKAASDTTSVIACIGGGAVFLINLVSVPFSGGSTSAGLPYTGGIAAAACGLSIVNDAVATIGYDLTDEDLPWGEFRAVAISTGDFSQLSAFSEVISEDEVTYMPLISTAVGVFLLYMIFSFCLDLGLRAVKLAFYELISPIPVLCRILPNNKIFNNWIKVTLTTFMEVFIRMVTLFTVVFLASNITNIDIPGGGFFPKMIIIMGIVAFGKQVPKLISDLFGIDSGSMKLGIMDKLNAGTFGLAGGVLGGITGFAGGALSAKANGGSFWRGGMYGANQGFKGKGNQFGKQRQALYKMSGGKGKAGLFGGRAFIDKNVDKLIGDKAMANTYRAGHERNVQRFEQSEQFQSYMQDYYNGQVTEAEGVMRDAQLAYDENLDIRNSYENSAEYNGIMLRYENQAIEDANAQMRAKMRDYAATPEGRAQYQKDREELVKKLQRKYTYDEIVSNYDKGIGSDESKKYVEALRNSSSVESDYKSAQKLVAETKADKTTAYEVARSHFLEKNTDTSKCAQSYRESVDFISKDNQKKEIEEWRNSSEGRKVIAAQEEALKNFEASKGGAKPKSDKTNK